MTRTWLALLGLLVMAGAQAQNPLCPRPLQAGWDPWEPYHYRDAQGQLTGSAVEVLREAARRVGCPLHLVENSWARTLTDIQTGRLDLAMEAQSTLRRRAYGLFSRPYRRIEVRLWVAANAMPEPQTDSLAELLAAGVRIGAVSEYAYGDAADKALQAATQRGQVQYVRADELNLRKLLAHRIDGFLTDQASSRRLALPESMARVTRSARPASSTPGQRLGLPENLPFSLVAHPRLKLYQDVRLMFSQASVPRELVTRFDEALAAMQADGSLEALLRRFHPEGVVLPDAGQDGP